MQSANCSAGLYRLSQVVLLFMAKKRPSQHANIAPYELIFILEQEAVSTTTLRTFVCAQTECEVAVDRNRAGSLTDS